MNELAHWEDERPKRVGKRRYTLARSAPLLMEFRSRALLSALVYLAERMKIKTSRHLSIDTRARVCVCVCAALDAEKDQ